MQDILITNGNDSSILKMVLMLTIMIRSFLLLDGIGSLTLGLLHSIRAIEASTLLLGLHRKTRAG